MIRVDQTKFGDRHGNCFTACIASILEMPITEVPNFCAEFEDWEAATQLWLGDLDLRLEHISPGDMPPAGRHYVVSGMGPRGLRHSCVGLDGAIVHDPHPSRHCLTQETEEQPWYFESIEPDIDWGYGKFVNHSPHCRLYGKHPETRLPCSAHCLGAVLRGGEETTEGGTILPRTVRDAVAALRIAAEDMGDRGRIPKPIAIAHSELITWGKP